MTGFCQNHILHNKHPITFLFYFHYHSRILFLFSYQKKYNMKNLIRFSNFKTITFLIFSTLFLLTAFAFSRALKSTPTVSVAADKMNLFYIGIDNPITVAMAGVPSENVKVSCDEAEIENLGNGHYNVRIKTVGKKTIKVEADGIALKEIEYRVKRIPDPIAMINFSSGGAFGVDHFKQQKKVRAHLSGWPLEEQCEVKGFVVTRQSKMMDPIEVKNEGDNFSETTLELFESIQAGDVVYFDNILCKCPGDPASRKINSMVFKMK